MKTLKTYICSECGSSDITLDVEMLWDQANQEWIIALPENLLEDFPDGGYCGQCESSSNIRAVEFIPLLPDDGVIL